MSLVGKRITILSTLAVLMGANIWAATASSFGSLRAARFLGGVSGGVVEGLGPLVVTQMFPHHQLGRAMVVYVFAIAVGASLGPMFAGIIALHLRSWRRFFEISAILLGANLFSCVLMLPETGNAMSSGPLTQSTITTTPGTTELDKNDAEPVMEHFEAGTPSADDVSLWKTWVERSFLPHKFVVFQKQWYIVWLQPFLLLLAPEVLTTVLLWAASIGWILVSSIISSVSYQQPPHLWNSQQVGLLNVGPFVGLILGFPLGGQAADRLVSKATAAGGTRQPRVRLALLIPGAIVSPVGCLLMGFTLQYDWAWIGYAAGYGMLAFGITSSCNILLTYSIELYSSRAAHIGIIVHMVKYFLSFGMTFGAVDWFMAKGPASQFGTMAAVLWVINFLPVLLYAFSARIFRHSSKIVQIHT